MMRFLNFINGLLLFVLRLKGNIFLCFYLIGLSIGSFGDSYSSVPLISNRSILEVMVG